jgi:hypothetical protein
MVAAHARAVITETDTATLRLWDGGHVLLAADIVVEGRVISAHEEREDLLGESITE